MFFEFVFTSSDSINWLELLVKIITVVASIGAIYAIIHGVRVYKKQTNMQIFLEYTKRYAEIVDSFPNKTLSARLNTDGKPPERSDELTKCVLQYLNLCAEEFYMWKKGYLNRELWKIWESELIRTLQSPLLRREWQDKNEIEQLRDEFIAYPEFQNYVDHIQNSSQIK